MCLENSWVFVKIATNFESMKNPYISIKLAFKPLSIFLWPQKIVYIKDNI